MRSSINRCLGRTGPGDDELEAGVEECTEVPEDVCIGLALDFPLEVALDFPLEVTLGFPFEVTLGVPLEIADGVRLADSVLLELPDDEARPLRWLFP